MEETTHHFFPRGLDPDDLEAFERWRDTLRQERRWADLAELYESRGDAVDDTVEAIHCYLAAADIWEHQAGSVSRALECLRRVLELEPGNRVAAEGLRVFLSENGRYPELLDLLHRHLGQADQPQDRARLCLEVAQLYGRALRQGTEAVRWYREAIRADSDARPSALSGLDALAEASAHDPATLAALEAAQAELGRWDAVAGLLRRRAAVAEDRQAKADLLCELGDLLLSRLERPADAVEAIAQAARLAPLRPERVLAGLRRLLEARPDDRSLLATLRQVHADLYRWEEVLELLEAEARLSVGKEAAALLFEAAELEASRLFRIDAAIERFRKAIGLDPALAHRVLRRVEEILRETPDHTDARRLLAEVMELTGDWDRLTVVLTDGASVAGRTDDRVRYLCQAAAMALAKLSDVERARVLYAQALTEAAASEAGEEGVALAVAGLEKVLEQDPEGRETLALLRDHYTAREAWEPLVRVLEAEAALARGPRAQAELHYEIGHVLEARLRRQEAAMAHYQRAFKLNPEDVRYVDAGRRLYRRLGKWDMVVRLLEIELQVTTDDDRRLDIMLDRAAILKDELVDPVGAFQSLLEVLGADPDHRAALARAKEILADEAARGAIRLAVEREAARHAPDGAARFVRIGNLHELDPPDRPAAVEAYRSALALQPDDTAVFRRVEAGLSDLGRWEDLVDLYAAAAQREIDPATEGRWRRKAADVIESRLREPRRAADVLRKALELAPSDGELRGRVVELLRDAGDWRALVDLYRWTLAAEPDLDPPVRRALLADWAATCQGPLSDPAAAAEPYRELLRWEPASADALGYFRADPGVDPRELVAALDSASITAHIDGPDLLAEAAEVCEQRLSDPGAAVVRWEDRLRRVPGDEPARTALHRLYRATERWGDAVALLLGEANLAYDTGQRVSALREAAALSEDELADPGRAEACYERLLRLEPDDRAALAALARLQRNASRWEPLADTLARLAHALPELEAVPALLERAEVLRDRLGRPRDALADLRRVLALAPEDLVALAQAAALVEEHGQPQELSIVLGRLARLIEDDGQRHRLYARMARLAADRLRDPARAVELWREVLEVAPGDDEALTQLTALHEQMGDWHGLAGSLRRRVEASAEPAERAGYLTRLGRLYREQLSDPDRAREAWEAVLALDPGALEVIEELEELLAEREDWSQVAQVLERGAALESSPAKAVESLRRLAAIRERSLGDSAGAIEALVRARDLDPAHHEVLIDLRGALVRAGEARRAVDAIEAELELFPEADVIGLCLEAGRLLRHELGASDEAAGWYERVLPRDPMHVEALDALGELYDELGRTEALVEVLRAKLELVEDDEARLELLGELGRRSAEAGDPEAAFDHLKTAHRLAPDAEEYAAALRGLAREHGLWDRLLEARQGDVVRATTPAEKQAILLESAAIMEEEVGDRIRAFSAYRMAFTLDPGEGPALAAMRRLADEPPLAEQLIPALEALADAAEDPEARIRLLHELAAVRSGLLEDAAGAFDDLRRAFRLDPLREDTREAVASLARETRQWEPLLELLRELQAHAGDAAARVALHQRAAAVLEDEAGDPERALAEHEAAFRLDPLVEATETNLVRLGEALGQWERLLRVFRDAAEVVDEPAVRARFLVRAARVQHLRLSDDRAALDTLIRAFRLDPRAAELPGELEALARRLGVLAEVLDLYDRVATRSPPDLELSLRRRAVDLLEADVEDPVAAIPHLQRVWELDPADDGAERALTDLLRAEGRWEELVGVHVAEIGRATERPAKIARLYDVAEIQRAWFSQPREAVATLEHILGLDPAEERALGILEALHTELGEPDRVVHYLEERARREEDPAAARSLRLRVAEHWDARLDRPDRARAVYRALVDADPDDERVLLAFEALCERERWSEDLLGLLELRERAASTDGRRTQLLWRMARIADDEFHNRTRALAWVERLLELAPDHGEAADWLANAYRDEGRWADLLRLLEARLERAKDTDVRMPLLLEIGGLHEERFRELESAIDAYDRAWAIRPSDPEPLRALYRLYRATGRWTETVDAGRALAGLTVDNEEAAGILFSVGAIYLAQLGDDEEALDALAEAVSWSDGLAARLPEQRRVAAGLGRADLELRLLELELDSAKEPAARAARLCELGGLLEARREDHAGAAARYEEALALRPDDRRALVALTAAYRSMEDWPAVDRCLERTVELLGAGDPGNTEHRARLAEVWTVRGMVALELDERKTAIERLYTALKLDPAARRARRALADLAWDGERWKVALEHLSTLCDAPGADDDGATLAGWQVRQAECLERLDRPEAAAEAWRAALEHLPESRSARRGHAEALYALGRWEEAADALAWLVDEGSGDVGARRRDVQRLAELLTDRLGRPEEGLARFEEAGRLSPEDPELLRRLLEGYRGAGQAARAADAAGTLALLAGEPEQAREAHLTHGALALDAGRAGEAVAAFARALDLAPESIAGALGLACARERLEDVAGAAEALDRHVAAAWDRGLSPEPEVWRLLGELRSRAGEPDRAEAAWRAWAAGAPQDPEPFRALAGVLTGQPDRGEELRAVLRQVVALDPADVEAWAGLLASWQEEGDELRAYPVADLLVFVKAAPPEAAALLERHAVGAKGSGEVPALPPELRAALVDAPVAGGPVGAALDALVRAVPGLVAVDPAETGLTGADRVDGDRQRSVPRRFAEVARALELPGRALYVREGAGAAPEVLGGDPPAVVVGDELTRGMFRHEQRFHLARGLALTAGARPLARALHADDGEALVRALRGDREGRAGEWGALLEELLEDGARGELGEGLAAAPDAGYCEWVEAVERSVLRAAFVLSGDLGTALKALRREAGADFTKPLRDPAALAELAEGSPLAADLLRYLASDQYGELLHRRAVAPGAETPAE